MPDWQVNIIKNSVFWQFMQFLGSISQYCIVITTKTCFELALHQNRPRAANFVGKRWIHNDFGWFLQLLLFWSSSVGLFWPFLGLKASQIPIYEPCHHKSLPGWDINPIIPIIPIIFAFQACYSQKSIFDIFGGIKWPPLRPRDLETSGYDAYPLDLVSYKVISQKRSCLRFFFTFAHLYPFYSSFWAFLAIFAPPL